MTRLRGHLPPVLPVSCPLSADAAGRAAPAVAISRPDDADR
jgi:hypothetical protein